ncbi:MAG: hypothetical protein IJ087_18160 [Eggerthellaceae bacterium]|nr:hypothetical protein [Eggerthellaceae bacterium]
MSPVTHVCQFTHGGEMCDRCRLYVFNECDGTLRIMGEWKIYDALLEWLRGDAKCGVLSHARNRKP